MYNLCRASYALNGNTSVYVHATEHRLVSQTCSRVREVPRVESHRGKSRKHPLHADQESLGSKEHLPTLSCFCQHSLEKVFVLICLLCMPPVNAVDVSMSYTCADLHKHVVQQAMHPRHCLCKQVHAAHLRGSTPFLMISDVFQHEITP